MANYAGKERLCDGCGVGVAVFDPKKGFVFIHRKDGSWSFPGGKIQFGESAINAVVRELEEETGLKVKNPEKIMFKGCFETAYKNSKGNTLHFVTLLFGIYSEDVEGDMKPQLEECSEVKYIMDIPADMNIFAPTRDALNLMLNRGTFMTMSPLSSDAIKEWKESERKKADTQPTV